MASSSNRLDILYFNVPGTVQCHEFQHFNASDRDHRAVNYEHFIEPACAADYPTIAAVNVAAFEQFSSAMDPHHWASMKNNISLDRVQVLAEFAQFFVCRMQGDIIGSVAYCPPGRSRDPIPSGWASILLLAVAPSHRGLRIGQALVSICLQRARNDLAVSMGLYTSELMTAAHRLYEQAGFQRIGDLPPRNGLNYFLYQHQTDSPPRTGGDRCSCL